MFIYGGTPGFSCYATVYPRGKPKRIKLKSCVSHHILPVEHLQDVTKQLAASLRLLLLLQVELQLVCHQWQEDLTAICRDSSTHMQLFNGFLTAEIIKLRQCTHEFIKLTFEKAHNIPKTSKSKTMLQS